MSDKLLTVEKLNCRAEGRFPQGTWLVGLHGGRVEQGIVKEFKVMDEMVSGWSRQTLGGRLLVISCFKTKI